jgi:hypothetical protein
MDKYNHPLILSCLGENVGESLKTLVFTAIERALSDHYEIMSLHWDTLERKWFGGVNHFCVKVHQYGWNYDDDTRRLHQMFMSIVNPVVDKRLEDYL